MLVKVSIHGAGSLYVGGIDAKMLKEFIKNGLMASGKEISEPKRGRKKKVTEPQNG